MKLLITSGPTQEPIDAVRYLGNRSSGAMGAALAAAAAKIGHEVTLIVGPVSLPMPPVARRVDVQTTRQMHGAVMAEFPAHDLLIMAAAVADFRPKDVAAEKLIRGGTLTLELEPTEDIIAAAGRIKRADQRTVGFSLESRGHMDRAREKLVRKNLDLIVFNPIETINSPMIEATLIYPDGRSQTLVPQTKDAFAEVLLECAVALFGKLRT